MNSQTRATLPRSAKGPTAPPPALDGPMQTIVDAVAAWPGVTATVHWHLMDRSRVDGVDFYWREEELGHLHLDGSIHLATRVELGNALVAAGMAQPFRYQRGWVENRVPLIGADAAVNLFRRNYEDLLTYAVDA